MILLQKLRNKARMYIKKCISFFVFFLDALMVVLVAVGGVGGLVKSNGDVLIGGQLGSRVDDLIRIE